MADAPEKQELAAEEVDVGVEDMTGMQTVRASHTAAR